MSDVRSEGRQLARLLATKMSIDGQRTGALASDFGISASYMSQLLSGDKSFASVDIVVLRRVARYLGLPGVVCFVLSGKIQHVDFLEPDIDVVVELQNALSVVSQSTYGIEAAVDVDTLWAVPESVRLLVVLMYEAVTGTVLVAGKKRWPWTAARNSVPTR